MIGEKLNWLKHQITVDWKQLPDSLNDNIEVLFAHPWALLMRNLHWTDKRSCYSIIILVGIVLVWVFMPKILRLFKRAKGKVKKWLDCTRYHS